MTEDKCREKPDRGMTVASLLRKLARSYNVRSSEFPSHFFRAMPLKGCRLNASRLQSTTMTLLVSRFRQDTSWRDTDGPDNIKPLRWPLKLNAKDTSGRHSSHIHVGLVWCYLNSLPPVKVSLLSNLQHVQAICRIEPQLISWSNTQLYYRHHLNDPSYSNEIYKTQTFSVASSWWPSTCESEWV